MHFCHRLLLLLLTVSISGSATSADETLRARAVATMRKAANYYVDNVASHGGYVYHYSLDLQQRWGEGVASPTQIWIQPPGTPTVGLAYVKAYEATQDRFYLDAAKEAALAVAYGQLRSGGWTNSIDFDPKSPKTADYRNGKGRGKNNSSLDDGQSQSAIRLLVHVDQALGFQNEPIHNAALTSLDALLKAQFPNGGFPQVWTGPVTAKPIAKANYPKYDWRTEGRIKEYWDMYTLNDNVAGYVAETLIDAALVYSDKRYADAVRKLGDFLILAQMPEPQPGWAQQYNYEMQPIWARKFEPPGVSGDETQEVIDTLMKIAAVTKDRKYLAPIPAAIRWLERSKLSDGKIARYYELQTNRPLYMKRSGKAYSLTYDDSNLPSHYGWKTESRIEELSRRFTRVRLRPDGAVAKTQTPSKLEITRILNELDSKGRWVSIFDGQRLVGQAKMTIGMPYLSSQVFSDNLTTLASYLQESQ